MIPYIFLTGFLGSGKTTLLNGLLKKYSEKKIGVIVNDFGDMGIDASLIESKTIAGQVRELKAGQIFCSCLSGSFVESVLAYEDIKPDLLLVECSGLAKPSSLKDITRAISLEAPGAFVYGGMVCLIDGERHLILEKSLMVLTEQMAASDLFLVTKTDLISEDDRVKLLSHLQVSFPEHHVIPAPLGEFQEDILSLLRAKNDSYKAVDPGDFAGWGDQGRPKTFVVYPSIDTAQNMRHKMIPYLGRLYRIKGVAETSDRGMTYFDGTSAGIELKTAPSGVKPGLVVITHDEKLETEWNE